MGMTIDEAIDWLDKSILKMRNRELCTIDKFALNTALETMRKYQKIEEIAEKCNLRVLPREAMSTFMKDVLEVIEDGNDNNANE